MSEGTFKSIVIAIALIFTGLFCVIVVPPLLADPDILGAFGAGFVNPFASGYSADVISCWFILAVWVWYEARAHSIKYGWVCLFLGVVPGVAVGFALYLVIRLNQLGNRGA